MIHIFGQTEATKEVKLYLVGQATPIVVGPAEEEKKEMTAEEAVLAKVAKLTAQLEALKAEEAAQTSDNKVAKNKRPGKAAEDRKYVRLGTLETWGKVPQQQYDIAKILTATMEVGKEYTEAEVFGFLVDGAEKYNSITRSVQDPTYLFRYYRGLKNDGKHGGFVARGFLKQIN